MTIDVILNAEEIAVGGRRSRQRLSANSREKETRALVDTVNELSRGEVRRRLSRSYGVVCVKDDMMNETDTATANDNSADGHSPDSDSSPRSSENRGAECTSIEETKERDCLAVVARPGYWSQNANLHPNYKRVKNWLWIHERYRSEATKLSVAATALSQKKTPDDKRSAVLACKRLFKKLSSKIEGHADFEDNQLFKALKEIDPTTTTQSEIESLEGEHSIVLTLTGRVMDAFSAATEEVLVVTAHAQTGSATDTDTGMKDDSKATTGGIEATTGEQDDDDNTVNIVSTVDGQLCPFTRLRNELVSYIDGLVNHFASEERVIVHRWLNLSAEEYKRYRSHLSWKYSFMY